MVYIIQCICHRKADELEDLRQQFKQQIREGVLLLPVYCQLREVVKDVSKNDFELVMEKPEYAPKIVHCVDCAHLKGTTPRGRKVPDCGWCEKRDRSVSYNAVPIPCVHFKDKNEEEK